MKKENILKKAQEIFEYYGIEQDKQPLVIYGTNAKNFYKKYLTNQGVSKFKAYLGMKNINGIFLYENIDVDFINQHLKLYIKFNGLNEDCYKNGVVCLLTHSISTLAHEIRHVYQLQHDHLNEFMEIESTKELSAIYSKFYVFYPNEQDAFYATLDYLKTKENKSKYVSYFLHVASLEIKYSLQLLNLSHLNKGIMMNTFKTKFKVGTVNMQPIDVAKYLNLSKKKSNKIMNISSRVKEHI